jgi:hypothetical protein
MKERDAFTAGLLLSDPEQDPPPSDPAIVVIINVFRDSLRITQLLKSEINNSSPDPPEALFRANRFGVCSFAEGPYPPSPL